MKKIEILKKFIVDNNLQFTEGRRNSDCVVISGFALYKECILIEVEEAIDEKLYNSELEDELQKTFKYAKDNDYGAWWSTEDAKKQYKF